MDPSSCCPRVFFNYEENKSKQKEGYNLLNSELNKLINEAEKKIKYSEEQAPIHRY